jgi:hypothetical protein
MLLHCISFKVAFSCTLLSPTQMRPAVACDLLCWVLATGNQAKRLGLECRPLAGCSISFKVSLHTEWFDGIMLKCEIPWNVAWRHLSNC